VTPARERVPTPGLAAVRAGLGPSTRLLPGPGHVVVATPERPDLVAGNAVHVTDPVEEGADLDRWMAAFDERLRHLPGLRHRAVVWETGAGHPDVAAYAGRLGAAASAGGARLTRRTVLELTDDPPPVLPPDDAEVVRVAAEPAWFGVRALQVSHDPEAGGDHWTWRMHELVALARRGEGASWLAYRFGIPVATASVLAAGSTGTAAVADVVTHPVHRARGLASHLVAVAAATHRRERPGDRLVALAPHGSDAERRYGRLGFRPVGAVWDVVGAAAG
jgi:GNAT superfamily N-acetyltransferase